MDLKVFNAADGNQSLRPPVIEFDKGRVKLFDCYCAPDFNFSVFFEGAKLTAKDFFAKLGFALKDSDLPEFLEVFFSREAALERLCPLFKVESSAFPEAFGGVAFEKNLFLTSEGLYRDNFTRLFGSELWHEDEFLRLAIHELIHAGHAVIAKRLYGTEDGMGPVWFFEGLAVTGSNQFVSTDDSAITSQPLTELEIRNFEIAVNNRTIEKPVYPKFGAFYRRLLQKIDQKWLIENAGKENFLELVIKKYIEE